MRRNFIGIAAGIGLALMCAPQAQAAAFLTITVGASNVTCNNSTAAGVTACTTAGFNTSLNAGNITFTGTVGGYTFGGGGGGVDGISLSSNAPGTAALAFTLDTKTQVTHVSGTDAANINYGVNGFTAPTGTGTLSASQAGTMTMGGSGGTETFRSWERNDNGLTAGPTGATAVSTTSTCSFTAAAPPTQSCMGPTSTVGSPSVTAPFALTSEEIITTPIGSVTEFTATTALTAQAPPPIPEPSSIVLLGTGMLLVAGRQIRKRSK